MNHRRAHVCQAPAPSATSPRAPLVLLLAYTVAFALLALWALSASPSALCAPLLSPLFPPPRSAAGGRNGSADGAHGAQGARGLQMAHGAHETEWVDTEAGVEGVHLFEADRSRGVDREGDDASEVARGAAAATAEAQAPAQETAQETQETAQEKQETAQETARFFLYRLIGNNMAPLQCAGQLLRNTLYALQHEARALRDCRRLWVVNHVVNGTERALLLDALLAHGVAPQLHAPSCLFHSPSFSSLIPPSSIPPSSIPPSSIPPSSFLTPLSSLLFPPSSLPIPCSPFLSPPLSSLSPHSPHSSPPTPLSHLISPCRTFLSVGSTTRTSPPFLSLPGPRLSQNEARNFILDHGRAEGARWVLAFDGNQFITAHAWDLIRHAALRHEQAGLKLFKVPMYRVYEEQSPRWLASGTRFHVLQRFAPQMWESQVAFRNDSPHRYTEGEQRCTEGEQRCTEGEQRCTEGMAYGRDNKLELIDRACGTGRFEEEHALRRRQQVEQRWRQKQEEQKRRREEQKRRKGEHDEETEGQQQGQAQRGRRLVHVECGAGSRFNHSSAQDYEGGKGAGGEGVAQEAEHGAVLPVLGKAVQQQRRLQEALQVDTGQCGCHREVGRDHRIKEADPAVAHACGYTVRLWYFPCPGVDGKRIFVDKKYRAALREEGHRRLAQQIKEAVRQAVGSGGEASMQDG
ncbi:unnamed protein product [Closterium sp. Naga37s-1]|nr:unnamed protein product [Closterium sp. Naga37s-1]